MFPNTRFRRSLVLIGGSGELGKVVTARFTKPLLFRWNVFNIDSVPNPDATTNFIIDTSLQNPYTNIIPDLHKQIKGFASEIDAVINLASPGSFKFKASLKDGEDLFDEYDRIRRADIQSTLLMIHLASNFLSANGYVAFNGDLEVFNQKQKEAVPIIE